MWFRGHDEREYNSSVSLQSMPHLPFGDFTSPCFPTVCIFLAGVTDPFLAVGGLNVSCSIFFSFTLFLRSLGFGSVFNCLPSCLQLSILAVAGQPVMARISNFLENFKPVQAFFGISGASFLSTKITWQKQGFFDSGVCIRANRQRMHSTPPHFFLFLLAMWF